MTEALKLVDEAIALLDKSTGTEDDALADVKPIDLSPLLDKEADERLIEATARELIESFHHYGIVIVRDPENNFPKMQSFCLMCFDQKRVSTKKNDIFLDMFEDYFNRADSDKVNKKENSKRRDTTKEKGYKQ
ncbi:hypothetical protein RFI_28014 [Reticulomyxa filosa]|uniref:Uncharacterized protein n=1 Tax=Reticulomyxa filosa TaxID=46433 RepID=X6M5W3_RETFI|nr:hypothetical protein RFI_28014 [Reticulomyxa filosa]|eukprot:ETO09363.1 hypothetical protein RFI_28014 [Reticulomyxa filosa]